MKGKLAEKTIVITAGGTGGHVFPAQGVAHEMQQKHPGMQILFIGGGLTKNRFFAAEAFPSYAVSCGSIVSKNPLRLALSGWKILQGIGQSLRLMHKHKPDMVLGFGSYYTFPTLVAAKILRIPIILHEANGVPGLVNRLFSRFVLMTGVHFPDTCRHVKGPSVEVGMPLRKGFQLNSVDRTAAMAYFNLQPTVPILLVFGGSQGAQSINGWMKSACVHSLFPGALQILHFTGDPAATAEMRAIYAKRGIKAVVNDFEPRIDYAWAIASLALTRAGASSISEAIEFEVPAILIPYPQAADNHQQKNAEFFSYTIGGALTYPDDRFTSTLLAKTLRDLLLNQQRGVQHMKEAIKAFKRKEKKQTLCDLILTYLNI